GGAVVVHAPAHHGRGRGVARGVADHGPEVVQAVGHAGGAPAARVRARGVRADRGPRRRAGGGGGDRHRGDAAAAVGRRGVERDRARQGRARVGERRRGRGVVEARRGRGRGGG